MSNWFSKLFGGRKHESEPAGAPADYQIRRAVLQLQPVSVQKAEAAWATQRKSRAGTLLIVGDPEHHVEIREEAAEEDPNEILDEAATLDADLILHDLAAQRSEDFAEDEVSEEVYLTDPSKLSPRAVGQNTFLTLNTAMIRPKNAYLAEVPCKNPWAVFAHVPFGEWNDVPSDAVLTAVFRTWYERFGAVPAYLGSDVIEFWVDRPVTDPVIACELAKEMYALCPDIVDQGVETVQNLAQALLNASTWYFWWD